MFAVVLRLALLVLLVWIGYKLARKFITPPAAQNPKQQFEAMVSCSHCGLHLPQSEALQKDGRHYCSQAHIEADKDH